MSRRKHPSIQSEVQDLAAAVFDDLGARATSKDVQAHVRDHLSNEQLSRLADKALGPIISGFFLRRTQSGLPQAPAVDAGGTHCQLELITENEYRYVIREYVRRSSQNMGMAYGFAKKCRSVHGVWIDPVTVMDEQTGT